MTPSLADIIARAESARLEYVALERDRIALVWALRDVLVVLDAHANAAGPTTVETLAATRIAGDIHAAIRRHVSLDG